MTRLEDFLERHSKQWPTKQAIVDNSDTLTYHDMWERVQQRSREYQVLTTQTVVVRATQTIAFVVDYLAAHLANKVFVPLEHDCTQNNVDNINALLSKSYIPNNVCDILFTTGTTGQPKGTMLSHENIIANAENLIDAQHFNADTVFIVSGPLNHIGSLSKLWPTLVVGGTVVITDGMKDIDGFFHALDYPSQRLATFLVPASIRILLQFGQKRLATYAHKIDFIETGAAPIAQVDMEQLCNTLPHTRLYNTYASTETGIIATHDFQNDGCMAGCLGKPMRHSNIHIDKEGYISCSGKTLMQGYVGDEALTQNVLHDGMCFTHDIGQLDNEGRLHLSGRNSDIINVGGYKINPIDIENAATASPQVADCICIAAPHPVLGTTLRLLVVTNDNKPLDKKNLAHFLATKLERHKVPQLYSQVDTIVRTYNGKLDRKHYENKP
ncbi:MAG: class I adenylate-forming enzyme family protein [Bacteroidales bacterium]|nr:class I adenylate-forming enzyme family protein [Bacteroidales bacterium]